MSVQSIFYRPVMVNNVGYVETENVLSTMANIAALNVCAYTNTNNVQQTLTLGASSNLICETQNVLQIYTSNGTMFYDTKITGTTRTDDPILNITRSPDTYNTFLCCGPSNQPNHTLQVSFSNSAAFNTFYINSSFASYDVLSSTKQNLVVDSAINFNQQATFNSNAEFHENVVSYGNFFASNVNVFRRSGKSGQSNCGFGFRVNASNQLELIKMIEYDDGSTDKNRVAIFGVNDVVKGQSDSAYQVFNPGWDGGVMTYSNGSVVTTTNPLARSIFVNSNLTAVGILNLTPQYPLDVTGVIRTNSSVICSDLRFNDDNTSSIGSSTSRLSNVFVASGIFLGSSNVKLSVSSSGNSLSITDWSGSNRLYVEGMLPLSGGTMQNSINMSGHDILNVGSTLIETVTASNATISNLFVENEISVSGSDYAEYMQKMNVDEEFAPGQVIGINASGQITSSFSKSIKFGIVSTLPSYIGGAVSEVVEHPERFVKIAYCGRVPLNMEGVNDIPVGSYVLPVAFHNDSIGVEGALMAAMTVPKMLTKVGQVICYEKGLPIVFV